MASPENRMLPGTVSMMVCGIWLSVLAKALALVFRPEQPVESGDLGRHFW